MTVIGALSSFRELGEMSPHKRASGNRPIAGEKPTSRHQTTELRFRAGQSGIRTRLSHATVSIPGP